ncbi:sigma-70 family RNA polymerase sigma factor [Flavivirga algicola]|uniref:Sigma-70 family RNA polymerase sigma factor n=1 Tax=Flavivirga algicola TaxID=2729136 RepID=A0ABX1RSX5_9FLAO|nr:sigma-70 family RNA polymerase sigma factor [Flavivirga algicola]NMH86655.1 sigma-70 family RNA polymerase sigma factor [Flavivirga algicola]
MEAIRIDDYKNPMIHDFDVIKKILEGEKGLFEILMRRNNQKLYRVIKSYINDETLIKDIMQDTYIRAYEKLHQFNGKSQFSTWLIRIGINEALRELRFNQVKKTAKSFIEDKKEMSPEKAIIQKEAKWILEQTIESLPEKYRVVYMLSEVENMSMKEISDCLDLSTSNVKVRIHRAKHMLKNKLYELSQKPNVFEFGFSKCDDLVDIVMKNL